MPQKKTKALLAMLVSSICAPAFTCTQEDAIESMRAMSQAQTELIRGTSTQQQRGARMAVEVAAVGRLLADSRFEDACSRYRSIAETYGVDLPAYRAQLAPLNVAPQDQCDTLQATRKVNDSYRIFNESVDTSNMTPTARSDFHKKFDEAIGEATLYVQTDPGKACSIVDATLARFKAG